MIIDYILTGIVFMFLIEYSSTTKKFKKHLSTPTKFGLWERVIGILLWSFCLGVFLYNFFKQFYK